MYSFPVRVEQSDVPVCEVTTNSLGKNNYSFDISFLESTASVTDYQYTITSDGKKISTNKSKNSLFEYSFPSA
ncbi:TPA: hypothetical protein DEP21_04145 [Patescibacteria group bacterium]|nr:hypothetical protein [Candidatus Gracilibacteria bacterium]